MDETKRIAQQQLMDALAVHQMTDTEQGTLAVSIIDGLMHSYPSWFRRLKGDEQFDRIAQALCVLLSGHCSHDSWWNRLKVRPHD